MNLSEKLKALRAERGITQERAAEYLGVSAQTVSKWERGLLSPDIRLLPKIAVLYEISLDALFDMDTLRGDVRREAFAAEVETLHRAGDFEGVYRALLAQIELTPDDFTDYPTLMLLVRRRFAGDEARIRRMIHLSAYADRHCRDDRMLHEIRLQMAHICRSSEHPATRQRAGLYLEKLPMLRHSRELQLPLFLEGEAREKQIKWNILSYVDRAECAVRLLVREDMPAEEQLALYRVAASLYDTVLGEGYGGFWDVPRLSCLVAMARLLLATDRPEEADTVMARVAAILHRHALPEAERTPAPLVADTHPEGYTAPEESVGQLVRSILDDPAWAAYHQTVSDCLRRLLCKE